MTRCGGGRPRAPTIARRRRRRAVQLPGRVEAERGRRPRRAGRSTSLHGAARDGRRGRVVAGSASPSSTSRRTRSCATHPHLTVTSITPFGLEGPWCDKPATEFTLQAWSGGIVGLGRGAPDRAPGARRRPDRRVARRRVRGDRHAGRRVPALATDGRARRRLDARDAGAVPHVLPGDVQRQAGPAVAQAALRPDPGRRRRERRPGRPRVRDRPAVARLLRDGRPPGVDGGPDAASSSARSSHPTIDAGSAEHTVDEVLDLASAFRIPNAPIANGANVTGIEHFASAGLVRRATLATASANPGRRTACRRSPLRPPRARAAARRARRPTQVAWAERQPPPRCAGAACRSTACACST